MAKRIARLRIIAGPNGSGKSTLITQLQQRSESKRTQFSLGTFLNADNLLMELNEKHYLDFEAFGISPDNRNWIKFLMREGTVLGQSRLVNRIRKLRIANNRLQFGKLKLDAYVASSLVEFMRDEMLRRKMDFSFETVFSHRSKISLIEKAKKTGYRVYLYYVATESALINIQRVKARALKGGHDVQVNKIISRYTSSLALLPEYVTSAHRAYIWDNSSSLSLIAEITNGETLEFHKPYLPHWVNRLIDHVDYSLKA